MSYAATNPPACIWSGPGGGKHVWVYTHTDLHTDVDATDYFTNGHALGMKVGDVVMVSKTTATLGTTIHLVSAVTVGGAATIAPAILA